MLQTSWRIRQSKSLGARQKPNRRKSEPKRKKSFKMPGKRTETVGSLPAKEGNPEGSYG